MIYIKTNERKYYLCNKYSSYLTIIHELSNGIMLQEQFIKIILALKIESKKSLILKNLLQLKKCEILKEQRFLFNSRFIILKKYALRYLKNSNLKSKDIASIPIHTSEYFYYRNIFKTEYLIREVIPKLKDKSLINIKNHIKINCSNFKITQIEYLLQLYKLFHNCINKFELKKDYSLLKKQIILRNRLLKHELTSAKIPQSFESTLSKLISKNIVINSCSLDDNIKKFIITINYMDISNKQSEEDMIYVYSTTYNIFRRLIRYDYNVHINLKICAYSHDACNNIKEQLLSKKNSNNRRIDNLLIKFNASPAFLTIKLSNYNIKEKYLK